MWLFFDSYNESGSASVKLIAETKEQLLTKIAIYTLQNEVNTAYFEIAQIKNNRITKENV